MEYKCTICGFIFDEKSGHKESNIQSDTKWKDVTSDWTCPLCGASKEEFVREDEIVVIEKSSLNTNELEQDKPLSYGDISIILSNYAKGCEKQYLSKEAELYSQLSDYFKAKESKAVENKFSDISKILNDDINSIIPSANAIAKDNKDRGALRAVVWCEKVSRGLNSLLKRYEKDKENILRDNRIYVCGICGFIYLGNDVPEICPVCKVPHFKIKEVKRSV